MGIFVMVNKLLNSISRWGAQPLAVVGFELRLRRRQVRADGVINEIENEAGIGLAVAERVQFSSARMLLSKTPRPRWASTFSGE